MSEPNVMAEPASLASLRGGGAAKLDPARFHYLEVLARRCEASDGLVRQVLADKLQQAVSEYAQRLQAGAPAAVASSLSLARPSCPPLVQLNQYIEARTQGARIKATVSDGLYGDASDRSEMKSLRGFRESWARLAAEQQVDQAVARGPENAGPLNSHLLVLRSLGLMRELSPDYLRRFLSHLDCLLWLDQAHQQYAVPELKPARRNRKDK
jgi:hypothetical protein